MLQCESCNVFYKILLLEPRISHLSLCINKQKNIYSKLTSPFMRNCQKLIIIEEHAFTAFTTLPVYHLQKATVQQQISQRRTLTLEDYAPQLLFQASYGQRTRHKLLGKRKTNGIYIRILFWNLLSIQIDSLFSLLSLKYSINIQYTT